MNPSAFRFRFLPTVLAALWLAGCGSGTPTPGGGPGGPLAIVSTMVVVESPWVERLEAIGTARASESIAITSKLSERVRRVRFESGQRVEAGQVLVELDVGGDVAELDAARTAYAEAQRQYERQRQLAAERLIPTSQLDAQRAARDAAQARVQLAISRVSDRAIVAPFAGVLGLREVSPGQLLGPGTVITTLDAVDTMQVDFAVPEVQLSKLREGLVVEARSDAWRGEVFPGRVISVDSRVDVATRSVNVRAAIDNSAGRLLPGMLLTMSVLQEERPVLAVPEIAVQQAGSQSFVFRVKEDGTAERVNVVVSGREPGRVAIAEGLSVGDRIVVDGTQKLRPGQRVAEATPAVEAAAALRQGAAPDAPAGA